MRRFLYICIVFLTGTLSSTAQDYLTGFGETKTAALEDLSMVCVNVVSHRVVRTTEGGSDYEEITAVDSGIVFPRDAVEYISHGDIWEARISRDLVGMTGSEWKAYESKTFNYGPQHLLIGNGGVKVLRGTHTTVTEVIIINPGGERKVVDRRSNAYRDYRSWNGRYGITGSYRIRNKRRY
jgi:hypothetical protein